MHHWIRTIGAHTVASPATTSKLTDVGSLTVAEDGVVVMVKQMHGLRYRTNTKPCRTYKNIGSGRAIHGHVHVPTRSRIRITRTGTYSKTHPVGASSKPLLASALKRTRMSRAWTIGDKGWLHRCFADD